MFRQAMATHLSKNAVISSMPLVGRREWIASREALRLVGEAYASHDIAEYDSNEKRQRAANVAATDALMRRLAEGTLLARPIWFRFAQGNRNDGSEHVFHLSDPDRTIDPNFWRTLHRLKSVACIDWTAGDFAFEECDAGIFATGNASGVKFDRHGLPALDWPKAKPLCKVGGAPRKWEWDSALIHLAALSHGTANGLFRENGSDPNQSDIARHLQA